MKKELNENYTIEAKKEELIYLSWINSNAWDHIRNIEKIENEIGTSTITLAKDGEIVKENEKDLNVDNHFVKFCENDK